MLDANSHQILPEIYGISDAGAVRPVNEDAIDWWIDDHHHIAIAILADGMGGHKGGALASRLVVNSVREHIRAALGAQRDNRFVELEQILTILVSAAELANTEVRNAREENPDLQKMGTTLVLVVAWQDRAAVLHVGDSRCYLRERSVSTDSESTPLVQLTRDDSVVQAMLEEGAITVDDIPNIPYRNTLTNAIGVQSALSYTLNVWQIARGDQLLICSDGFHNVVSWEAVLGLLDMPYPVDAKAKQLIQMSLDQQTDDNTSVILMQFDLPSELTAVENV